MQSGSAREKKRDWEDCADALSLLLLSSRFPRSQNTHSHTLASTLAEGPLPLAALAVRNWRLSPAHSEAGRGGRRVKR